MTSPYPRESEISLHAQAARQTPEFAVFKGTKVNLTAIHVHNIGSLKFWLRLELEAAWLLQRGVEAALARLAGSRAAAQYIQAESGPRAPGLPAWVPDMAGDVAPSLAFLQRHFGVGAAAAAAFRAVWPLTGTADSLMETGGDIRLARDPRTALNGYGCSHRPRPWAVTFASSTASSSSARGYIAADRARLSVLARALKGMPVRAAVRAAASAARRGIAQAFALPAGCKIILAASGTDTELLALALSGTDKPILNILVAPSETGRGVPMAARGVHFAVDTARGAEVTFEAPIAGFRPDTELASIQARAADGSPRAAGVIEAEIGEAVAAGIASGRRVLLHALDLSKTGLLAPRPEFLQALRARHGASFDIVVDACQARLSPASLRAYLALDAVVLVTGSKFFTGPPFAGAAILPASIANRLRGIKVPAGLAAYFGQDDVYAPCQAAQSLPAEGNYGLALRWHAALAEMRALLRVPPARRAAILEGFGQTVRAAIARYPALALLDTPPIARHAADESWERCQSIFTFSLRAPHAPGRCLTPVEARAVYLWLNADLAPLLPRAASLAGRICHIGQPVPLPQPGWPEPQGALRVAAGARLISGEPSHRGMRAAARLQREFDDLAQVFAKIDLILRHWSRLWAANPMPNYRPSLTYADNSAPVT